MSRKAHYFHPQLEKNYVQLYPSQKTRKVIIPNGEVQRKVLHHVMEVLKKEAHKRVAAVLKKFWNNQKVQFQLKKHSKRLHRMAIIKIFEFILLQLFARTIPICWSSYNECWRFTETANSLR